MPCKLPRHVLGADHEATERAEGPGSGRSQKVEARNGGFEPDLEHRIALAGAQRVAQRGREEVVSRDVHTIPGREEQVIDQALGPVRKREAEQASRRRGSGCNRAASGNGDRREPRAKPHRSARAHRACREEILQPAW